MKKLLLIFIICLISAVGFCSEEIEMRRIKTVCIEGYKYVVVVDYAGMDTWYPLAITQMFEKREYPNNTPQPIRCKE